MNNNSTRILLEDIIIERNDKFIEKELKPFLSIPSHTLNKKGIEEAKNFIISYISNFALTYKNMKVLLIL